MRSRSKRSASAVAASVPGRASVASMVLRASAKRPASTRTWTARTDVPWPLAEVAGARRDAGTAATVAKARQAPITNSATRPRRWRDACCGEASMRAVSLRTLFLSPWVEHPAGCVTCRPTTVNNLFSFVVL